MKLTALTCTYRRPSALRLCEKQLARQTRQPDQWLVLDGPDRMQKKVLDAIEGGKIEGDAIAFVEDDDHYRHDWLAWCAEKVGRGYDLVGEGNALYYHVGHRWWSECGNARHAALCQTACHSDFLPSVANCIKSYDWPFFDIRIWQVECSKFLALPKSPAERRVIGIKGILSEVQRPGYSGEHRDVLSSFAHADPSLFKLWQMIGSDAEFYRDFHHKTPPHHDPATIGDLRTS